MKEQILEMILNTDGFISGEEIATRLGITRAGVWKHIKTLKEDGYGIESVTKKGYRVCEICKDMLNKQNIQHNLKTKIIGSDIKYFQTIDSTNDYAKKIADESMDGTLIISEEQTKGRGRIGKKWHSDKGDGIWTSIILKPNIEPYRASFITLVAGASIVKALGKLGIEAKIKWPNDIILNNKKICGILTELSAEIQRINYIVVGIGINVKTMKFDEEIENIATSIYKEGHNIERLDLIKCIIEEFEKLYESYIEEKSYKKTIDICRTYSAIIGNDIYLIQGESKEKVKCIDIDDEGHLVVKDNKGIRKVMAGEVSIRGEKGYV